MGQLELVLELLRLQLVLRELLIDVVERTGILGEVKVGFVQSLAQLRYFGELLLQDRNRSILVGEQDLLLSHGVSPLRQRLLQLADARPRIRNAALRQEALAHGAAEPRVGGAGDLRSTSASVIAHRRRTRSGQRGPPRARRGRARG